MMTKTTTTQTKNSHPKSSLSLSLPSSTAERTTKEIQWTDDQIRWDYDKDENEKDENETDGNGGDDDEIKHDGNGNDNDDDNDFHNLYEKGLHAGDDGGGDDEDNNNNNKVAVGVNDDDDDGDDDGPLFDPFADPDPQQTFHFHFPIGAVGTNSKDNNIGKDTNDNNGNKDEEDEEDQEDRVISSSSSIDIVLNGYKYESDAIWKSTGLTIWRASEYLCRYMIRNLVDVVSKGSVGSSSSGGGSIRGSSSGSGCLYHDGGIRVLELGAGLGLCGILAYRLLQHHYEIQLQLQIQQQQKQQQQQQQQYEQFASDREDSCHLRRRPTVCITDGDTDVLVQLRDNIQRNCGQHPNYGDDGHGNNENRRDDDDRNLDLVSISCRQLLWGKETSRSFLEEESIRTTVTSTDGDDHNEDPGDDGSHDDYDCDDIHDGTFDLILASDIVYSPVIIKPLWETIQILLSKPSASASIDADTDGDIIDEGLHNNNYNNNNKKKKKENGRSRSSSVKGGQFWMSFAKRRVPVRIEDVLEAALKAGFSYELVEHHRHDRHEKSDNDINNNSNGKEHPRDHQHKTNNNTVQYDDNNTGDDVFVYVFRWKQ